MQAPSFWFADPRAPGALPRLLTPASLLWQLGGRLRAFGAKPYASGVPSICVGNLTAGGAGKTPMVAYLAERLAEQAPHIVMRGHGGRLGRGTPHRVEPSRDGPADVGDEALLHAATHPTWVARDRAAGLRAAEAAGAGVLLLDDGYQNPHLAPRYRLLMVDAGQGFGNGRLIPAGPLREPLETGLSRADLVVLAGPEHVRQACLDLWPKLASLRSAGRLVTATLQPVETGLPLTGAPVVAFAGIGRPEKFFATLRAMGADLRVAEAFPDHHVYAPAVLDRLIRRGRAEGAVIVTTEKDAVRLPERYRTEVMALPVRLVPEEIGPLNRLLDDLSSANGRNRDQ
ncbi:MAG: tetraacyldisaccharide 4'-kinase [Pseudomonadota bacterium]